MISFILIAAAMTVAVIAFLIWPLWKPRDSASYERPMQNIHFARERLQELDQQLQSASISAADHQALKLEIEAMLAEDIDLDQSQPIPSLKETASSNGILIALICGLLPFAALVLYQITGTPEALEVQTTQSAEPNGAPTAQDIDVMVRSLEQRLQANPDDLEGRAMLARTYLALGRYPEAIAANQQLLELGGENPDVYASMADASALLAGGNLAGQPSEYVRKALQLNPQHPQALWLAGLAAAQQGNNVDAREAWEKLLPLLADVPSQQEELRNIIRQTFSEEAMPAASEDSSSTASNATAGLMVRVELAASLSELTSPDDLVFIFAKAENGPPAPLAVRRLRVSDLPAEIELSDADSMVAQFKLSLFENVVVSARVAKSGDPVAQPGDFQSPSISSKNKSDTVIQLTISEIID